MATRKYTTEYGFSLLSDGHLLFQEDDLRSPPVRDWVAKEGGHIYAVCRRPRIRINEFGQRHLANGLRFSFGAQIGPIWRDIPARLDISPMRGFATFSCPFPHSWYRLSLSGSVIGEGKPSLLMMQPPIRLDSPADAAVLDLQVLYIGQSYGEKGSRTALDRLASHSTLQKIHHDNARLSPDMEIWLLLFGFQDPFVIAAIDGTQEAVSKEAAEKQRLGTFLNGASPLSMETEINYAEAALIRYFAPPYNEKFREVFPSPEHKAYAQCYQVDLNTVSVEVQTDVSIGVRLFSSSVPPQWHHLATFPLHPAADRVSMMDFSHLRRTSE